VPGGIDPNARSPLTKWPTDGEPVSDDSDAVSAWIPLPEEKEVPGHVEHARFAYEVSPNGDECQTLTPNARRINPMSGRGDQMSGAGDRLSVCTCGDQCPVVLLEFSSVAELFTSTLGIRGTVYALSGLDVSCPTSWWRSG